MKEPKTDDYCKALLDTLSETYEAVELRREIHHGMVSCYITIEDVDRFCSVSFPVSWEFTHELGVKAARDLIYKITYNVD